MSHLGFESAVVRALRGVTWVMALALAIATPGIALANPTGANVAHGGAAFATPNAATLNITTSNGAIINWEQFGINPGEVTRFLQQGGSAAVLNRVVGGTPSAILGSLLSNGRVFLINPNGVVFGPNAVVDTAGLVVSTLNMSDDDFINGRLHFAGDGTSGAVVNQGEIRAQGSIILIAPRIENSGLIETAGGGLLLAAGREVTITSFENPEIAYLLEAPKNEVVNLGQLITNGGAASVFAGSIRHSGDIDASSVVVGEDGHVRLVASGDIAIGKNSTIRADGATGGTILVHARDGSVTVADSTLTATGDAGAGGDIHVLGNEVNIVGASTVDASGRDGGGEVLIGGDYQGKNTAIANAENTRLGADARLIADATGRGDGGKVIIWSDGTTQSAGDISARGGASGGDGGFVEVSGKQALGFSSHVDTLAPHGTPGMLLLDPFNIIAALGGGAGLTDVDSAADPSGGVAGCDGTTCTVDTAAINGAASPVTLQATNDITIANAINISTAGVSFTAQANKDILVSAPITTNNAAIMLQANQANNGAASGTGSVVINNALNSTGGAVSVQAGGNIDLSGGSINAGNGAVDLLITGGTGSADILLGDIATTGDVTVINQNLFAGSDILQPGLTAITGTRVLLEMENNLGPATAGTYTIGTAANPIRIADGVKLEAHGHVQTVPIFIQGLGNLKIGDGGAGIIEGIDSPSGVIEVSAAGTLTLLGGGSPGHVRSGGGGSDDISLSAGNGIFIFAEIDADTDPVALDAGAGGAVVQDANGHITAGKLKVTSRDGITLNLASNDVAQLTAENTTTGNIDFTNSSGVMTLAPDGTAFAVRNSASNGFINIAAIGAGAGLTTSGLVEAPNGISNQLQLQTPGLLTIGGGSNISTPGTVFFLAADMDILAPVAGALIEVNGFGAGNLELGVGNMVGNGTLELSQADINQLGATSTLSLGNGSTQNISVSGAVSITAAAPLVKLTSLGQSIDFNAAFNAGTRNLTLTAAGVGSGDGEIRQNGAGVVTANVLNLLADVDVFLNSAVNQVAGLSAAPAPFSGIRLNNASGVVALALNSISSNGAPIVINNAGGISITGIVDAGAGNASITESILDISGAGGRVQGNAVTLAASSGGVGNGTVVITDTASTLNLSSGGPGAAGNIDVEEVNAISTSSVNITTDSLSAQTVKFVTASGNLTIDSAFGDSGDNYNIRAEAASLLGTAGSVAANNLTLRGSNAITLNGTTFNSSGTMSFDGGNGTLLIDNSIVTAGAAFTANAAEIDVYSSTINGSTLLLTSSGATHVSAGGGGLALLGASDSATFNAGTLMVEGGSSTGDSAKIQATNTVTVNATDVIVKGGSGSGAFASIDPITVIINAANDILVQAGSGSGASAEIAADNLVNLSAGRNIDIIGDAESAVIKSSLGNVLLSALGGVTLAAGAGSNGDAVIAANGGLGTVDVTSSSCVNCVLLGFDPFANAGADQGIFAAALNLMSLSSAPAAGGGSATGDSLDISDRDVLVLEDLAERLAADGGTGDDDDDDDDDDQKICR